MSGRALTFLLGACLLGAPVAGIAAPGEVRVPRDVARESVPPPFSRTCTVRFDQRLSVEAACPLPVYEEAWEGPLLLATNTSGRTIWVSYVYDGADGRTYQGPCYELPATSTRAVPDQAILPLARRLVRVSLLPGPGFPVSGYRSGCTDRRQVVTDPPWD